MVNCTGIGARSLVPDESLVPVRGQVVVVENPGIGEFYLDHGDGGTRTTCTLFPHGDVAMLGGTAHEGAADLGAAARGRGADPAGLRRGLPVAARRAGGRRTGGPAPGPAGGAARGRGTAGRAGAVAQLRARRRGRDAVLGLRPRADDAVLAGVTSA